MDKKMRGDLMLLTTAVIWGSAFVAQRVGMDYIGPLTFNGLRFLVGALILVPVILVLDKKSGRKALEAAKLPAQRKQEQAFLLKGSLLCGLALAAASSIQQFALVYTTAGKTGFITALYIVIVPVLGLFIGKKVKPILWVSVVLGIVGLYLLSINEGFSVNIGDVLAFVCAFGFALHILMTDHFSPRTDSVRLSALQFLFCGLFSTVLMFLFESPKLAYILEGALPILYTGIMSCGVAYTFQIVAQKNVEPTMASLILSLESVFAVLFGFFLLQEQLMLKEILGCVIMFTAIILAQLPDRKGSAGGPVTRKETL